MRGPLDSHVKPPMVIKNAYKAFQKLDQEELDAHPSIIDPVAQNATNNDRIELATMNELPKECAQVSTESFYSRTIDGPAVFCASHPYAKSSIVFEVKSIPGLFIYPSLLPPDVQLCILDKLLHRDLCKPRHQTNIHLHYTVPYPNPDTYRYSPSFFDPLSTDLVFTPKDQQIHKPLGVQQFLRKKLRWMTLGGQYDWTNKNYPSGTPPSFPPDIKKLVEDLFPVRAEAAIVNLYSPGDTLSLHRDVSEECDQPLVSISFGCDGVFVVGLDNLDEDSLGQVEAIRLRSGDAVLMSGKSRYAWHGVPKVIGGTCPDWMEDWPFEEALMDDGSTERRFEEWKGWVKGKRINLNVRQMFD